MIDEKVIQTLAEFFLEEFDNDASSVGEWLAQGGQDVEKFYKAVQSLKERNV